MFGHLATITSRTRLGRSRPGPSHSGEEEERERKEKEENQTIKIDMEGEHFFSYLLFTIPYAELRTRFAIADSLKKMASLQLGQPLLIA